MIYSVALGSTYAIPNSNERGNMILRRDCCNLRSERRSLKKAWGKETFSVSGYPEDAENMETLLFLDSGDFDRSYCGWHRR